jgi:hypothetical protein
VSQCRTLRHQGEGPGADIASYPDRGGTFTDCIATVPGQDDIVLKLLSVDPSNYKDAPVEAVRRVLEKATGRPYPKHERIPVDEIGKAPLQYLRVSRDSN